MYAKIKNRVDRPISKPTRPVDPPQYIAQKAARARKYFRFCFETKIKLSNHSVLKIFAQILQASTFKKALGVWTNDLSCF